MEMLKLIFHMNLTYLMLVLQGTEYICQNQKL